MVDKMRATKDMTNKEAMKFYGKSLWGKMLPELRGNTCSINSKGELVNYAHDLNNAYSIVMYGKRLFWD